MKVSQHGGATTDLLLGDIIRINAPTKPGIHDKVIFIFYLDSVQIDGYDTVTVDSNDSMPELITIALEDGIFVDTSIVGIDLLDRADEVGYARQNGLTVGVWTDIYFGGPVPAVCTSEIISIDEDMIELRTYPDKDLLYLDFAYSGIPKHLPIEKIVIRDAIVSNERTNERMGNVAVPTDATDATDATETATSRPADPVESAEMAARRAEDFDNREFQRKQLFSGNQLIFGADMGVVSHEVVVSDDKKRYGIDVQMEDLLNEMIANVSTDQRTDTKIADIHQTIERYKQLRTEFSKYDKAGNITGALVRGEKHRPIVDRLVDLNENIPWIIPVSKSIRRVYDLDPLEADGVVDVVSESTETVINNQNADTDAIEASVGSDTRYKRHVRSTVRESAPFHSNWSTGGPVAMGSFRTGRVARPIESLADTSGDLETVSVGYGAAKDVHGTVASSRFVVQRYLGGVVRPTSFFPVGGRGAAGQSTVRFQNQGEMIPFVDGDELHVASNVILPKKYVGCDTARIAGTDMLARVASRPTHYWKILREQTQIRTQPIKNSRTKYDATVKLLNRIPVHFINGNRTTGHIGGRVGPSGRVEYRQYLEKIVPNIRSLFQETVVRGGGSNERMNVRLYEKTVEGAAKLAEHPNRSHPWNEFGTTIDTADGWNLSIVNILKRLRPFYIYHADVSYKTYAEMNEFLLEEMKEYKSMLVQRGRAFASLAGATGAGRTTVHSVGMGLATSVMRTIVESREATELMLDAYGFTTERSNESPGESPGNATGGYKLNIHEMGCLEIIRHMKRIDRMELYAISIASAQSKLMTGSKTDDLERLKAMMKSSKATAATVSNDKCSDQVVSNQYYSIAELEKDDNVPAVFHSKYDTTRYEFGESYRAERAGLGAIRFRDFMVEQIKRNVGMSEIDAEVEADAIILGKRVVRDGNYAVLEIREGTDDGKVERTYYNRIAGKWVVNDTLDISVAVDSTTGLCFLDKACRVTNETSCQSVDKTIETIDQATITRYIADYDAVFDTMVETNTEDLRARYEVALERTRCLNRRYNERFVVSIDRRLVTVDSNDGPTTDPAPTATPERLALFEKILSQNDLAKRSTDILKFARLYSRSAINDESIYWHYCNATGGQLVPSFMIRLAEVFVTNGDYSAELDIICKDRGTVSDDGDAWIDRYSARTIRLIDGVDADKYNDSGYKMSSNAIIDADRTLGGVAGILGIESAGGVDGIAKKTLTRTATLIRNVVNSVSTFIGVDGAMHLDYVTRNTTLIIDRTLPSKDAYDNETRNTVVKPGKKKRQSYIEAVNRLIALLSVAHLFVSIQTAVPRIRVKRTFPGCVRSFDGYPYHGVGDTSGIAYISCIVAKMKASSEPWNAISSMRADSLTRHVEDFITRFIIETTDYKAMSAAKRIDDVVVYGHSDNRIGTSHISPTIRTNDHTLYGFRPPMDGANVTTVPISTEFMTNMKRYIKTGDKKQEISIEVMRDKAKVYALGVQQAIQRTVDAEILLMQDSNDTPFMENACCTNNVFSSKNTISYFAKKRKELMVCDTVVREMEDGLHDVRLLRTPAYLVDLRRTKKKFGAVDSTNQFSDMSIVRAILHYQLNTSMKSICPKGIEGIETVDDITDQTVERIRGEGIITRDDFNKAFLFLRRQSARQLDHREGTVDGTDGTESIKSSSGIEILMESLGEYSSKHESTDEYSVLNPVIIDRIISLIDGSVRTNERTNERTNDENSTDHFIVENTVVREKVVSFMKQNCPANVSENELKKLSGFMLRINQFPDIDVIAEAAKGTVPLSNSAPISIDRLLLYTKMFIHSMTRIFPTSITNRVDRGNIKIPVHWITVWKISGKHAIDIIALMRQYYESFGGIGGDKEIESLCREIADQSIVLLQVLEGVDVLANRISGAHDTTSHDAVRAICEYTMLATINLYVRIGENPKVSVRRAAVGPNDIVNTYIEPEDGVRTDVPYEEMFDRSIASSEITIGDNMVLRQKVVGMMNVFLGPLMREYEYVSMNYADISRGVLNAKEKEKDAVTARLKSMNEEQLDVEKVLKDLRLGDWNVGMQKGMTQYVGAMYDHETTDGTGDLLFCENVDGVTDTVDAFYNRATDMEEMDMSHIPDDDDDDGD